MFETNIAPFSAIRRHQINFKKVMPELLDLVNFKIVEGMINSNQELEQQIKDEQAFAVPIRMIDVLNRHRPKTEPLSFRIFPSTPEGKKKWGGLCHKLREKTLSSGSLDSPKDCEKAPWRKRSFTR